MERHFIICVKNQGYDASLELRKFYEVLPDPDAQQHGQVRVVDESGEDYLYPKSFFMELKIPAEAEDALLRAA